MINKNTDIKSHEGPHCKISDRTKYSFLEFDFFSQDIIVILRRTWKTDKYGWNSSCKKDTVSHFQINLVFSKCAQPDQGRRHHPPPPYVFGKPKYPIVNTYKSWFSSTHASRNRSKFWNQSWVCYPSCHPPCWINISFWSFVNFFCCCGAETCILINIMFWCTGSGITDYCCWMQMNAIL